MAVKEMNLRRDGACRYCDAPLGAGTKAQWDSEAKRVACLPFASQQEASVPARADVATPPVAPANDEPRAHQPDAAGADLPGPLEAAENAGVSGETADAPDDVIDLTAIDRGAAGASAQHEFERRRAKREANLEAKYGTGMIGKIAKAFSIDPQTTTAWDKGAVGERAVSAELNKRLGDRGVVLDDRKATRGRANFDRIVIGPSGVWIVDTKNFTGRPERKDVGGWFKTDVRLFVGGRDQSKIVNAMEWQRSTVRAALDGAGFGDVPLHLALCMHGADWGIFPKPFQIDGVWITWSKKLAETILGDDLLDSEMLAQAAVTLATRFPPQRVGSSS